MINATIEEQQIYEKVHQFLCNIMPGETKKWRNTHIERLAPIPLYHMYDGEGKKDFYHWHPHMAAIIVITLCEELSIGQVKEVGS